MRHLVLAVLLAASSAALACGHCVEDKVASVYDHELIRRAVAGGRHVVFFHVDGPVVRDEATRRALVGAAESLTGVDRGSVRVALETQTLALCFDPRRGSLVAIQESLEKRLAARRLVFYPLKMIERPAELKEISRR